VKRPGGQAEHDDLAPSEKVPAGQFWHTPTPLGLNLPGAHLVHAERPVEVPSVPG